ncbi:MAG: mannitol dehydrogenase family protein [Clostridiales bacterium]|nr:mannitol dehydrogenase family protein [Clostridiales bacterium]
MKLNLNALRSRAEWGAAGYTLPAFDIESIRAATASQPRWLHLGAGNIFRAFPAAALQRLLDQGAADTGLITAECFDGEIIDRAYSPFDCLSLLCVLKADGGIEKKVIASVTEALRCDGRNMRDDQRLTEVLAAPSLQMVSFTITEKGYAVCDAAGAPLPHIRKDLDAPPEKATSTLGKVIYGLWERFRAGAAPLSLVSMDNCSHNGDKLKTALLYITAIWHQKGYVTDDFLRYLSDERQIACPISMIDKITPRPDAKVAAMLQADGFEDAAPIITEKGTYTAAFVNAEETEYLVVEDRFPAGRPSLEKAGVYFTDRETVDKAEKMKVCTCLNPLHTTLAILGCLLAHTSISKEMQDEDLNRLVHRIAYQEAMPVVTDPGILSPAHFAGEVLEKRFPNPFMPDTPQRIATDTSQKLPIRFGETLKAYQKSEELDIRDLKCIPFVLAAWLRYLMAIDDQGNAFIPSPDPLLSQMQSALSFLKMNEPVTEIQLASVLSRQDIFGLDLLAAGLGPIITGFLNQLLAGKGAVRNALRQLLSTP